MTSTAFLLLTSYNNGTSPLLFIALLVFVFVAILGSNAEHNYAKRKGQIGEEKICEELLRARSRYLNGIILSNVYIPKNDGETTEIDVLFITSKGLIVIESKNYKGYIFGSETYKEWTVTLSRGQGQRVEKDKFYNPVWQNRGHINNLKKYLNQDIPIFSIIDFGNGARLMQINISSPDVYVINTVDLQAAIRDIEISNPDVLNDKEINEIYRRLLPLTNADKATQEKHITDIKTKIAKQKAEEQSTTICPRCGGKLVLRTAKTGYNAGNQFYGCENYPRCRYTRNLK